MTLSLITTIKESIVSLARDIVDEKPQALMDLIAQTGAKGMGVDAVLHTVTAVCVRDVADKYRDLPSMVDFVVGRAHQLYCAEGDHTFPIKENCSKGISYNGHREVVATFTICYGSDCEEETLKIAYAFEGTSLLEMSDTVFKEYVNGVRQKTIERHARNLPGLKSELQTTIRNIVAEYVGKSNNAMTHKEIADFLAQEIQEIIAEETPAE